MTTRSIHPAEERLLDAALAQVLAGAAAPPRAHGSPRWLVAALVLLGVAVTAASAWLARAARADEAQDPPGLPPAVTADGREELDALPADTVSLHAKVLLPEDVAVLARFRQLRALTLSPANVRIAGVDTRGRARIWSAPPAGALEPLAQLPALESLLLSSSITVTPALLAPLRRCGALRELELHGEHVVLDDAMIAALRALPALRSLRLDLVRVDAAVVARLRPLPLTALRLARPIGFDGAAFEQLLAWPELERLGFADLGRTFGGPRNDDHAFWMPPPQRLERLAALPRLRALELRSCTLTDEHLAALPRTLTALALHGTELSPDGFGALRRFGTLRRLEASPRRHTLQPFARDPDLMRKVDALADALGALRLRSLQVHGPSTATLLDAVAAQPDLAELSLYGSVVDDGTIETLARAPALRRLGLSDDVIPTRITVASLAPLRANRSLRELVLHVCEWRAEPGIDERALRAALGGTIVVRVHRTGFARAKR